MQGGDEGQNLSCHTLKTLFSLCRQLPDRCPLVPWWPWLNCPSVAQLHPVCFSLRRKSAQVLPFSYVHLLLCVRANFVHASRKPKLFLCISDAGNRKFSYILLFVLDHISIFIATLSTYSIKLSPTDSSPK